MYNKPIVTIASQQSIKKLLQSAFVLLFINHWSCEAELETTGHS